MTKRYTETTKRYNGKCPACKIAFGFDALIWTEITETARLGYAGESLYPKITRRSVVSFGGVFERIEGDLWITHACGRAVRMNGVCGTTNDTTCGARCLSSHGPTCDCSCGGSNHGRGLPGL